MEDYIDILRRHKGWVFGPFLFTLVASVVGAFLWPNSYDSRAVIIIHPQQVPENMVQSSINQDFGQPPGCHTMSAQIRSHAVLTNIIQSRDLYKRERGRMPMEDVVELMNKKIVILPLATSANGKNMAAFSVQFTYDNRLDASKVTGDLVSKFIDSNQSTRSNISFETDRFFKDQTEQAAKELKETEDKLAAFRMQFNGRLPDQVEANVRTLQNLESNLLFLDNAISRGQSDKLQMDANIRIYKESIAALSREPQVVATQTKSERLAPPPPGRGSSRPGRAT